MYLIYPRLEIQPRVFCFRESFSKFSHRPVVFTSISFYLERFWNLFVMKFAICIFKASLRGEVSLSDVDMMFNGYCNTLNSLSLF